MNTETPVVIDIECFRYRNLEWVVKEIAVYGDYLDSMVFKAPYLFNTLETHVQKAFRWLTNNFHGLDWNSGDYPYERLQMFVDSIKLRYPNSTFYSKGFEKTVFLSRLFGRDFIDLESMKCPRYNQLSATDTRCTRNSSAHLDSDHCARKKVHKYANWLEKQLVKDGKSKSSLVKGFDNLSFTAFQSFQQC